MTMLVIAGDKEGWEDRQRMNGKWEKKRWKDGTISERVAGELGSL